MKRSTYICCGCISDKIEFVEEYSNGIEANKRVITKGTVIATITLPPTITCGNNFIGKLISGNITKLIGLFFSDKFLLERIGYLLTIFVIFIFSLVIFFAFLVPHLNILIAYQFWTSFVFILLMYLSVVSVYSYLDCKKELSAKIKKSLIQYYLIDSYIRKTRVIKNDELEKLKNEVNQDLSPLIVMNVKLLKLIPLFFIVNLDDI